MKKGTGIAGFIVAALVFIVLTFIQKTAKESIQQDFEKSLEDFSSKIEARQDSLAKNVASYNSLPISINDKITLNSIKTDTANTIIIYPKCYFTVTKLDEDKFKEDVASFFDNTEPFKHWTSEDIHFECSVISSSNDTTYVFTYPSSVPSSVGVNQ